MSTVEKRLDNLLRHISGVRANCELLGGRLIEKGEVDLGIKLIANGQIHDTSKFIGVEFEYLCDGSWPFSEENEERQNGFKIALKEHLSKNPHHPEFFDGGIEEMPRLFLAEFLCDTKARSSEFGTSYVEWLKEKATKKFKFSLHGKVYKDIKYFTDLLLEDKFK